MSGPPRRDAECPDRELDPPDGRDDERYDPDPDRLRDEAIEREYGEKWAGLWDALDGA